MSQLVPGVSCGTAQVSRTLFSLSQWDASVVLVAAVVWVFGTGDVCFPGLLGSPGKAVVQKTEAPPANSGC